MLLTPALEKWRQKEQKFKVILGYPGHSLQYVSGVWPSTNATLSPRHSHRKLSRATEGGHPVFVDPAGD